MHSSNDYYLNNPLIHKNRMLGNARSHWVKSFDCTSMKPLIICRGPIRKEAMDVFEEMGIKRYGILLSEKDSITYTNALAPELRQLTDPGRVHRVPDYSGVDREERTQRIEQIIQIARDNGYNSIFAGYGFMAEDEEMVSAMENAGLNFIGPCSKTVHGAGLKDEAKRTALSINVSVTPGVDNATTLTVLSKYADQAALVQLCYDKDLQIEDAVFSNQELTLEQKVEVILNASMEKGIDLFSVDELGAVLEQQVMQMYERYPDNRVRLKAISGGGGKGQRILKAPSSYEGSLQEQIKQAAMPVPGLVLEILNEVKCNGVGDNKNVLAELNIETTRHQEIQVVGNGNWCVTMGGRDCSLQMHEQKLLEVSVTTEELHSAIDVAEKADKQAELETLRNDLATLERMEIEAARFGQAVGLDSVSTFECIVDGASANHFFMEMNTRIQVEHRVTELCYKLKFTNPENPDDFFIVESLVEAMVVISLHGKNLPKPKRIKRETASVEARLNATNQALQPHAGGVIERWSNAMSGEIRDDQGISMHNPDTDVFMKYHLAGAYDSNVALLLTVGNTRLESYQRLAEIIRCTVLGGKDLATNLEFHYGLVNWFIGNNINARPSTRFIVPYLTAVGQLKHAANQLDLKFAYNQMRGEYLRQCPENAKAAYINALDRKQGLLLRPLNILFADPHKMSGWLSVNKQNFIVENNKIVWLKNPIEILAELYHYLHMDYVPGKSSANMIWEHDNELLQTALGFYNDLGNRLRIDRFSDIEQVLTAERTSEVTESLWEQVKSAHAGFQIGVQILSVLPHIALKTGFYNLKTNDDLSINIPEVLTDPTLQGAMAKVLVPPPVAKSDEILALSGGMYYPREAPEMPSFVEEGSHFNEGDPLYIVEVMKMFNKVYAPFSGTIDKVLVETDGTIIKKGQPLFKISPDDQVVVESADEIKTRMREKTAEFLESIS